MAEIILCNQPLRADSLQNHCDINSTNIVGSGCINPAMLNAYTPYMVEQNPSAMDHGIFSQLTALSGSRELPNLSHSFGGDNVVALADITAKLQDYNIGLMGASTSVYANRIGGFAGSVKDYQAALMEYRQAVKSNLATKTMVKQKAFTAFEKMQTRFRHELAATTAAHARARKGTPLTNATRATNIARSSRNVTKLNVSSQIQASNLVKFGKYTKFLGNGLAVIDFGSRIGNIHNSYQAKGNWERDMFIESSSFTASVITGSIAVEAGLAILMVATPVGWVGLIIGGAIIAGAAAGASMGMNNAVKQNSGDWYDSIMKWINS